MTPHRRQVAAAAVFAFTGAWLYWLNARRFVLVGDEGIFVDGARRILDGQVPYRDFFIVMGPGTFWLQALALRIFGITLAASRAVTVLDLSILAACVFWLVSRVNAAYAAWTAAVLVILETADPSLALPTHRWDSAALATLVVTICAAQISSVRPHRGAIFLAGCCAAFAAWITPPVGLVGMVIACWMWMKARAQFWPYAAGFTAVTISSAVVLAIQGALVPMVRQFFWTGSNYSASNHMFYGSRFGGYGQLFADAGAAELLPRGLIVLGLTLPAILPLILILCFWSQRKDPFFRLVFFGGLALIASTYPRMDVAHLTYVAPLFYALTAILAASAPWPKARVAVFGICTLLASLFAWHGIAQHRSETSLEAGVGAIRASADDVAFIQSLEQEVPRGSRLFVFPYLPMAHFLTLDRNPTRYSYLQPGMMNEEDESTAISELSADPPEKVLYFNLPESDILRIWPKTDPTRLRLRRIEAYLSSNYHRLSTISYGQGSFEILEPNAPRLRAITQPPGQPSPMYPPGAVAKLPGGTNGTGKY